MFVTEDSKHSSSEMAPKNTDCGIAADGEDYHHHRHTNSKVVRMRADESTVSKIGEEVLPQGSLWKWWLPVAAIFHDAINLLVFCNKIPKLHMCLPKSKWPSHIQKKSIFKLLHHDLLPVPIRSSLPVSLSFPPQPYQLLNSYSMAYFIEIY